MTSASRSCGPSASATRLRSTRTSLPPDFCACPRTWGLDNSGTERESAGWVSKTGSTPKLPPRHGWPVGQQKSTGLVGGFSDSHPVPAAARDVPGLPSSRLGQLEQNPIGRSGIETRSHDRQREVGRIPKSIRPGLFPEMALRILYDFRLGYREGGTPRHPTLTKR